MNTFQVGDRVKWTTQKIRDTSRDKGNFGHKAKEAPVKHGVVMCVLEPGVRVLKGQPARSHVSYAVWVKKKAYWPPVSRLQKDED